MAGPQNASINAGGFRIYKWEPADGGPSVDVLSVTSIRRLTGLSHTLVEWQIGNIVRLACGIRKQTTIGPRGGIKDEYVPVGEGPGEFVNRMLAANGDKKKLDAVRKWLRATADEPRDTAATRGTVVHACIETNLPLDILTDEFIVDRFNLEGRRANDATADDVNFVRNAMRQYWDMRAKVPFVIIAREPQVWNLTAGYAGSLDAIVWFLPDGLTQADLPKLGVSLNAITAADIIRIGGKVVLGDWKTSKDVYTDHAVQITAYMAGEFIGTDGVRNQRLTDILDLIVEGALIHIRPDGWSVEFVPFREDILTAFLGSCAFARFLAFNPTCEKLVTTKLEGKAADTEASSEIEDEAA